MPLMTLSSMRTASSPPARMSNAGLTGRAGIRPFPVASEQTGHSVGTDVGLRDQRQNRL